MPESRCCGYLICRIQSSECGWWMARKRWSDVYVYRPTVSKWISRCRTHDTWSNDCNEITIKAVQMNYCIFLLKHWEEANKNKRHWNFNFLSSEYVRWASLDHHLYAVNALSIQLICAKSKWDCTQHWSALYQQQPKPLAFIYSHNTWCNLLSNYKIWTKIAHATIKSPDRKKTESSSVQR